MSPWRSFCNRRMTASMIKACSIFCDQRHFKRRGKVSVHTYWKVVSDAAVGFLSHSFMY